MGATGADRRQVNPFKLFYYRHSRGWTLGELCSRSGITTKVIRRLEARGHAEAPDSVDKFPKVDSKTVRALESALGLNGHLGVGADDFSTQFVGYYHEHKNSRRQPKQRRGGRSGAPKRAVIFDFDGTLTKSSREQTTWESLWEELGYGPNECGELASRFFKGELSHEEWCRITCEKFEAKGLTRSAVVKAGREIELIPGIGEALESLRLLQIPAYIVSGSIWDVLITALGDYRKSFARIEANMFLYDADAVIAKIAGTRYDFSGKAEFTKLVASELGCSTSEILFVGNSINDKEVKSSGARALLVNPHFTHSSETESWDDCIHTMRSLVEILPHVDPGYTKKIAAEKRRATKSVSDLIAPLDSIRLEDYTVVGKYRRFDNKQRASLIKFSNRIVQALRKKTKTRENFLVWAAPGSGKTFLLQEIAAANPSFKFVEIDVSGDSREEIVKKLELVEDRSVPTLCMLDEIDGKADEGWVYDVIYKYLDLNETDGEHAAVFALIGSSGSSVEDLSNRMRSRFKGPDLVDRIPKSDGHFLEIPPLGIGDSACVYVSKVLDAAEAESKSVQHLEKLALFHAVVCFETPRQLKMLADSAVARADSSMICYDNHFEDGSAAREKFVSTYKSLSRNLATQIVRIGT